MLDFFVETYWGGIILTIVGIIQLYHTIKYTKKNVNSVLQPFTNGIFSGIGFIIAGLVVIIGKLLGKL